jgi:hypothetical protein
MIWLNSQSAKAYAENGSDVVYTTPFYVAGMGSSGYLDVYNAQIMPEGMTEAAQKHILGAEICMWGESMGPGNLGVRAFQIGAAAAENFWRMHARGSGVGGAGGLALGDRCVLASHLVVSVYVQCKSTARSSCAGPCVSAHVCVCVCRGVGGGRVQRHHHVSCSRV